MDDILTTLRNTRDDRSETLSNFAIGFLLFFILACGHILFFYNPDNILKYTRTPLIIMYILLTAFVSFFIFKRMKNEPLFNLPFEVMTHTITFGKMILFIFIVTQVD